jgi:hypothetical protein
MPVGAEYKPASAKVSTVFFQQAGSGLRKAAASRSKPAFGVEMPARRTRNFLRHCIEEAAPPSRFDSSSVEMSSFREGCIMYSFAR